MSEDETNAMDVDSDDDSADYGDRRAVLDDDMTRIAKEFAALKDRLYQEKLEEINAEIQQLEDGNHVEFMSQVALMEQKKTNRIKTADFLRKFQLENIAHQFASEKKEADQEFVRAKGNLHESMLSNLQEKLRKLEEEKQNRDLNGDPDSDRRAAVTRKLRRRVNEPNPMLRRKVNISCGPHVVYSLKDAEISEDLYNIRQGKVPSNTKRRAMNQAAGHIPDSVPNGEIEAYVNDGKLFYGKHVFDVDHQVIVDTVEPEGTYTGVISALNSAEVFVRRSDQTPRKTHKLHISQLRLGKYSIRSK